MIVSAIQRIDVVVRETIRLCLKTHRRLRASSYVTEVTRSLQEITGGDFGRSYELRLSSFWEYSVVVTFRGGDHAVHVNLTGDGAGIDAANVLHTLPGQRQHVPF